MVVTCSRLPVQAACSRGLGHHWPESGDLVDPSLAIRGGLGQLCVFREVGGCLSTGRAIGSCPSSTKDDRFV